MQLCGQFIWVLAHVATRFERWIGQWQGKQKKKKHTDNMQHANKFHISNCSGCALRMLRRSSKLVNARHAAEQNLQLVERNQHPSRQ